MPFAAKLDAESSAKTIPSTFPLLKAISRGYTGPDGPHPATPCARGTQRMGPVPEPFKERMLPGWTRGVNMDWEPLGVRREPGLLSRFSTGCLALRT